MRSARGFTLLEVLVALTVIALALGSIIKVVGSGAANASYLRDKTFAHWVASNRLAQMQLKDDPWPSRGGDEGEVEMAGREWFWTSEVSNTPDPDMRRVDITVRLEEDDEGPSVSVLTGFIAKLPRGAGGNIVPTPNSPGLGSGEGSP
jgi:general secretion pathway protein I